MHFCDINSHFRWTLHILPVCYISSMWPSFDSDPIFYNLMKNRQFNKNKIAKCVWKVFFFSVGLPFSKHFVQSVWRQVNTNICWVCRSDAEQCKHRIQPNFWINPLFWLRSIFNRLITGVFIYSMKIFDLFVL